MSMYWTEAEPYLPPFRDPRGVDFPELYDEALRRVCMALDDSPAQPLREAVTTLVQQRVVYRAGVPNPLHPLDAFSLSDGVQCDDHAILLSGLFRSVGVDATTLFVSNGVGNDPSRYIFGTNDLISFQVARAAEDNELECPHFVYHAIVSSQGLYYDAVYGWAGSTFDFKESVDPIDRHSFRSGNSTQIRSTSNFGFGDRTGARCPHNFGVPPCQ